MKHLNLGVSRLGLGLVAWVAHSTGFKTAFFNRAPSSSHDRNELLRRKGHYVVETFSGDRSTVPFDGLDYFGSTSDQWNRFIDAVADADMQLLTTTLGDALEATVPMIATSIIERHRRQFSTPIVVMACENRRDSRWLQQQVVRFCAVRGIDEADVLRTAQFVPVMVDRICTTIRTDSEESVIVAVEDYAEWLISKEPGLESRLSEMFARAPESLKLVDALHPYSLRKLCMVNGAHILICLFAHARNYAELDVFLKQDSDARDLLDEIIGEVVAITATTTNFSIQDLQTFGEKIKDRFISGQDLIARVLSRLRGHQRAVEFAEDFHKKIGRSALQSFASTGDFPEVTWAAVVLAGNLASANRFVEDIPLRPST